MTPLRDMYIPPGPQERLSSTSLERRAPGCGEEALAVAEPLAPLARVSISVRVPHLAMPVER
eukprot:CAMPEP_0180194692 /NCGR_PEP_ID=MMETSP0987-20121128/3177_1 /TAXON_ID=697907 /ORGANISM="non described non described, Strain CCMP2293" /LENGTH=61 /DNA_ID=CAMNT_0022149459 /DNA_START=301 /DNA_END=483 /DNA_ORIENTATION=+